MNFCTRSPVTRILLFCVICSLHVHMFTKTLSGLILCCQLFFYDTLCVTSRQKSGHLRDGPVYDSCMKKRGRRTFAKLPPHLPQTLSTLVRHVVLWSKEGFCWIKMPYNISTPPSFSLMTLLQLCFGCPLPALVHCSLPPVLVVLAPVLWSTRLNPSECIDCPDEAIITA